MRLVSFRHAGANKFGAAVDGGIVDLSARTHGRWTGLRDVIAAKALDELRTATQSAAADLAFEDVELLPVIPDPDKILCVGLNYASHVGEVGRQMPTVPSVFSRLHNTLVRHGGDIVRPRASTHFDYEGELAGKNFPATGPLGPWMVTSEVIADPQRLELTTRLNGTVVQHDTTDHMIFDVATIIEYLSTVTWLEPGDIIATGTPVGVGIGFTPPKDLEAGDRVRIEIEGIGVIENPVR